MHFFKGMLTLAITIFLSATMVGQGGQPMQMTFQMPEISDSTLRVFANILPQVNQMQMQSQQEMVKKVQESGLDVQRFNEIAQSQQNPNQPSDATEAEMKSFQAAMKEVQAIQKNMNAQLQQVITSNGMSVSRFQEIAQAVNSDKALQQKVQQMMGGSGAPAGGQ